MVRVYVVVGLTLIAAITAIMGSGMIDHAASGLHVLTFICSGHEISRHVAELIHSHKSAE